MSNTATWALELFIAAKQNQANTLQPNIKPTNIDS